MAEKMTLVPCKECGSKDTSWSCAPRNNGQSVDGRICMREVGMQFYRGCDSCGETLEVIGADEFLVKLNTHLTQPAQAVDVEPDPALLASMATCLHHGFGLLDGRQQQSMLHDMRKVWDEVMGRGYYRPENRDRYMAYVHPAALPNANGKEG